MFLSVSLLSFIKPPHRPALSFFALGARRRCAPLPLTSRIGLLRFILAVSSFVAFLSPHFFNVTATYSLSLPLSAARSISRLTCQLASLGISPAYRLPVSNFTTITVAKLAVFVRLSRLSFFLSHVTTSRPWRAAIRAYDEWPLRRASSSIVNVFLLLHPSMPTALPSINISFHLSGSSFSLGVALFLTSRVSRVSPDTPVLVIFLDLPSSFLLPPPSFPRSFSSSLPALVGSRSRNFCTGSPHLVPLSLSLSPCPRYFLQFASYSSVPARHHHRPLRPSIDI